MIKSFLGRKDKSLLAFFGSLCGAATSMPVCSRLKNKLECGKRQIRMKILP